MKKLFLVLTFFFGSAYSNLDDLAKSLSTLCVTAEGKKNACDYYRSTIRNNLISLFNKIDDSPVTIEKVKEKVFNVFLNGLHDLPKNLYGFIEDTGKTVLSMDFSEHYSHKELHLESVQGALKLALDNRWKLSVDLPLAIKERMKLFPRKYLLDFKKLLDSKDFKQSYENFKPSTGCSQFFHEVNKTLGEKFEQDFLKRVYWEEAQFDSADQINESFATFEKKYGPLEYRDFLQVLPKIDIDDVNSFMHDDKVKMAKTVSDAVTKLPRLKDLSSRIIKEFTVKTMDLLSKAKPTKKENCLKNFMSYAQNTINHHNANLINDDFANRSLLTLPEAFINDHAKFFLNSVMVDAFNFEHLASKKDSATFKRELGELLSQYPDCTEQIEEKLKNLNVEKNPKDALLKAWEEVKRDNNEEEHHIERQSSSNREDSDHEN